MSPRSTLPEPPRKQSPPVIRRRTSLVALMNLVHLLVFSWVALILAGLSANSFGAGSMTALLILGTWGVTFLALQVLFALTAVWIRRERRRERQLEADALGSAW